MQSGLFSERDGQSAGPVECFGIRFDNDDARRSFFIERLREKLKDPQFRSSPGFPIGDDEDILALSDPPYFTACPNPFLQDFIGTFGTGPAEYAETPLAVDVSEGKNDPVYSAHSYPTKVPPKAVAQFIEHYTRPGALIVDPFSGSGMTGVGVAIANDSVRNAPARRIVLNDLSPAASFISELTNGRYTDAALDAVLGMIDEAELECGSNYRLVNGGTAGTALYTIWSEVFRCTECGADFALWDVALDAETGSVLDEFGCNACGARLTKRTAERVLDTYFDELLKRPVTRTKTVPVEVDWKGPRGRSRIRLEPGARDELRFDYGTAPDPMTFPMLFRDGPWGDQWRDGYHTGVSHFHHFYTPRNFIALSHLRALAKRSKYFREALGVIVAITQDTSRMARVKVRYYFQGGGGPFDPGLAGTLFIPSFSVEKNPFFSARNRVETLRRALCGRRRNHYIVSTGSAHALELPANSMDYCFVDPPFGDNLAYSELNFLAESWLRVFTRQDEEAIVSKIQSRDLPEYGDKMAAAFRRVHRALRPGRWMTVEFSNTKASVWNVIQVALERAGFVVASVAALDKKQRTFNALTTTTSVQQDLVISCYKPEVIPQKSATSAVECADVVEFLRRHLAHLTVFSSVDDTALEVVERTPRVLYDRLVAWWIQTGQPVSLSSGDLHALLRRHFPERDGMFFLAEQVSEYDRQRARFDGLRQYDLFVRDEATAIEWIRQCLRAKPQTYQEVQPAFLRELQSWAKHESAIELRDILEQNFLRYDGTGPVPTQIHTYLSNAYHDLRGLDKTNPRLVERARDRWYVPDPSKQAEREKLRERELLKEFEEYKTSRKKLKQFRTEAVRAGFKAAYDRQDYRTIVEVASKLPERVLQEDEKLLMYYDVASMRVG